MKRLFLTSSFVDVAQYFLSFINDELKAKSVTFIPTASMVETYKGYVINDKRAFEELGLRVYELDVSKSTKKTIKETIAKNDFIYISGGNTFYLLQELKNSGADQIIMESISSGKPYIGASAGSIIMSPNIEYVAQMDDKSKAKELKGFDALGMVDFYPLPHHTNEPFKSVVERIIANQGDEIELFPISNTEAIEIFDTDVKIVGTK